MQSFSPQPYFIAFQRRWPLSDTRAASSHSGSDWTRQRTRWKSSKLYQFQWWRKWNCEDLACVVILLLAHPQQRSPMARLRCSIFLCSVHKRNVTVNEFSGHIRQPTFLGQSCSRSIYLLRCNSCLALPQEHICIKAGLILHPHDASM